MSRHIKSAIVPFKQKTMETSTTTTLVRRRISCWTPKYGM
jgi:hypothetical protein